MIEWLSDGGVFFYDLNYSNIRFMYRDVDLKIRSRGLEILIESIKKIMGNRLLL